MRLSVKMALIVGSVATVVGSASWLAASQLGEISGNSAAPEPLPPYLTPTVDPATGYTITRVTNPGGPANVNENCEEAYCTHRYSSSQAWSADQKLLLISMGCHGLCFLDGQTYAPLFHRQRRGECEWHPRQPERMICVAGHAVSLWDPRSDQSELIYSNSSYRELRFGPLKGNPSRDGRWIVVRGTTSEGLFDALVIDIDKRKALPPIHLEELPGKSDYCSISPLGTYVVCVQDVGDDVLNTFVLLPDGRIVQSWTENHRPGHGDMTVDDAGDEVYVGISKSDPDRYHVIKRRLKDSVVTSLAGYGEGQHVSLRATTRPEWAFVSYAGDPAEVASHPDWAQFEQEVVAFPLGGSGAARLIAETHNVPFNYWSETHASPSPDGSQVIWSSNWGKPGGPVFDFVTRVKMPEPVN